MRRDLVADLREHLAEVPSLDELGTPQQYAAELRAAAGLGQRRGPVAFVRARRPRNLILTVLALTLAGLVVGAIVWVDGYQPLAADMGYGYPVGAVEDPSGLGQSVVFRQGHPFRLALDIENAGRFAVRVLGVSYGPGLMPFTARLVMSKPMKANTAGFPPPWTRFRPFDLRPGEARALMLKGVWANCKGWNGGGSRLLLDFPLRYSFLWRTGTADIRLPEPLAIVYPKGFRCR